MNKFFKWMENKRKIGLSQLIDDLLDDHEVNSDWGFFKIKSFLFFRTDTFFISEFEAIYDLFRVQDFSDTETSTKEGYVYCLMTAANWNIKYEGVGKELTGENCVGFIKIGFTEKEEEGVYSRLSDCRTGCPMLINIAGSIKGSRRIERELHWKLCRSQTDSNNEWFFLNNDSAKILKEYNLLNRKTESELLRIPAWNSL